MPAPTDPILREEWIRKLSYIAKRRTGERNSFFGKKHSTDSILKMKEGHKKRSESWRIKQHEAQIGKRMSEASRKKMSEKKIGISRPEKVQSLLRVIRKGAKHTIESKNKMSESLKNSESLQMIMSSNEYRLKQSIAHKGEKCHLWKGGISFYPYCLKFNNQRKRAVRVFFDNFCIVCGKHADENVIGWNGNSKVVLLDVHHIDHDKEQGCNGRPFNLIPLCRTCHLDERFHEEEYHQYINRVLDDGFKWGIWSEKEYTTKVMYDE